MRGKAREGAQGGGVCRATRVFDGTLTQAWAREGDVGRSAGSRKQW